MKHITTSLKSPPQQPVIKNSGLMNGAFVLFMLSILTLFSSCSKTYYTSSARVGKVEDAKVSLIENVADVEVDFENRVQATSLENRRVAEAKNQAYYRAIINNKIDILVDPIYEIVTKSRRSIATVSGYAGTYNNVRTVQEENQLAFEQNMRNTQVAFDQSMAVMDKKIQSLDKFSKLDAVANEDLATHLLIITGGEDGTGAIDKEINTNISIVDKYNAFSGGESPAPASGAILSAGNKDENPGLISKIEAKMNRKNK